MKKHKIVTIIGFLISLLLLYFSLRGIEFHKLFVTLKNADMRFVFLPLLCVSSLPCSLLLQMVQSGRKRSAFSGYLYFRNDRAFYQ